MADYWQFWTQHNTYVLFWTMRGIVTMKSHSTTSSEDACILSASLPLYFRCDSKLHPQYQISWKFFQQFSRCYMRIGGQTNGRTDSHDEDNRRILQLFAVNKRKDYFFLTSYCFSAKSREVVLWKSHSLPLQIWQFKGQVLIQTPVIQM
jgi:hypothetical protein